jgi:hypothetical protein
MQEAILGEWGIHVLAGEDDDPERALTSFLGALRCAYKSGPNASVTEQAGARRR